MTLLGSYCNGELPAGRGAEWISDAQSVATNNK